MRYMLASDRIIVAADYKPSQHGGRNGVRQKILDLAKEFQRTGVIIKLNSSLRALGYDLISQIHALGVRVMADLKLVDITETLEIDAEFLRAEQPALLTAMAQADADGLRRLRDTIHPDTELLAVTVLTSFDQQRCARMFGRTVEEAVVHFARVAIDGGVNGLVLSAKENALIREAGLHEHLTLNNPAIRPTWSPVSKDDQSRTATIREAFESGADRIIIGRPITRAQSNAEGRPQSPLEALQLAYAEVEKTLAPMRRPIVFP